MALNRLFLFVTLCGCVLLFWFCHAQATQTVALMPYSREVVLTGFTRAQAELTLSSEVSGRCETMLVDKGDVVTSPGIIAKLDSTFITLELEKNKIAREQARSQLELEKKTVARYSTLIEKKSAPLTRLEETSLQADIYRLTLESLKNEETRLGELFQRHTLYGPLGWQVIERLIEPGEFVSKGQPVIRLGDYRNLLVPILLTYEELSLLKDRDTIQLYLRELNTEVEGTVYRIGPGFDQASKKIVVDLLIHSNAPELSSDLRSGLHVQLKLKKKEGAAFIIPFQALISRYESHWLESPEKKRVKVILLGTVHDGKDAIISGAQLAAGDLYMRSPEQSIDSKKEAGQ